MKLSDAFDAFLATGVLLSRDPSYCHHDLTSCTSASVDPVALPVSIAAYQHLCLFLHYFPRLDLIEMSLVALAVQSYAVYLAMTMKWLAMVRRKSQEMIRRLNDTVSLSSSSASSC